jgi:4'-phosphopantetheinyl transferase
MDFSNIHKIVINPKTAINLLSYKDFNPNHFEKYLLPNEKLRLISIHHETRKREFVATRMLRNSLFGLDEITNDSIGAPHIGAEKYISISHTIDIVGIAISDYKIGFDLEPIRDKAIKLFSKFLHQEEFEIFDTKSEIEMTKIWSAKETLYKLAGRKKIIFKDELRLHKVDENWFGTIYNPDTIIHVPLRVFDSGHNVLTINSAPIEIEQRNI